MKLYDCRVRINGSLNHVVNRVSVTAAEIALLRHIHSRSESANEPIIDIVETGEVRRKDSTERRRLSEVYSFGELSGERLVNSVFGIGTPLPHEIELTPDSPEDSAPETDEDEDTVPSAPVQIPDVKTKKRGRPSNAELAARVEAA